MSPVKIPPESTILVLHAGAIGDVVLGTLAPMELKRVEPSVKIIYWTHESLFDLLRMCPAIDELTVFSKRRSLPEQLRLISGVNPHFIVDQTASLRTRIICALSGKRTFTYRKQPAGQTPVVHAADNFRATITQLIGESQSSFPSLKPSTQQIDAVRTEYRIAENAVAIVPGVGKLRSHRAWTTEGWAEVARRIQSSGRQVILIGGPEDAEQGDAVTAEAPDVVNLCGRLSLPQTACALAACSMALSGDTGPMHIAVGVGTPVAGMFGPTDPQRSGPHGYLHACFNAYPSCQCHLKKQCSVTACAGPGQCMQDIKVEQALSTVDALGLLPDRAFLS
jgi:heptosyltransferase-1